MGKETVPRAAERQMTPPAESATDSLRLWVYASFVAVLTLLFIGPLMALMRYAAGSDLHSHIVLVPVVSAGLLYLRRAKLRVPLRSSITGAACLAALGALALAASMTLRDTSSNNDAFSLTALAFVSFVAAGGFLFLGSLLMRAAAFPMAFLAFLAPLPDVAVTWIEHLSVLASADAAGTFFAITGTPLLRNGTIFELPGITLQVAQECSGIRSSWVLFITSLVVANLELKNPWGRLVLVLFVIPLAIARNGFRVFVIGMLCVHVGPHMIDSIIHYRGGPLFFALSLVPLFGLLLWLRRFEHESVPAKREMSAAALLD